MAKKCLECGKMFESDDGKDTICIDCALEIFLYQADFETDRILEGCNHD